MAQTIIINIARLVNVRTENKLLRGDELCEMPIIENAYLIIENGVIKGFGAMHTMSEELRGMVMTNNEQVLNNQTIIIDATATTILPTWCDSHTHLVFAATREEEFVDKLNGLTYAEINAKGGGILNSARKLNAMSEDELYDAAWSRLQGLIKLGTGAIEIKSGYGLCVDGELKMLRVIKRLKQNAPIIIKSTFLGAHTFPPEFKEDHEGYIKLIIESMLPVIARENLADYIDVFCENGFFNLDETERICKAGLKHGLKIKLHVNQMNSIGGTELGVRMNAISLDHLEVMNDDEIHCLSRSNTVGTLLPTAAYFLRVPFQPARKLINNGCAIALASDYNPGTSPSGNMNTVVSMSCIAMKLLPEESLNAATINGAFAMEVQDKVGCIMIGKHANFIFMKNISSLAFIPYSFGSNLIDRVMINGEFVN